MNTLIGGSMKRLAKPFSRAGQLGRELGCMRGIRLLRNKPVSEEKKAKRKQKRKEISLKLRDLIIAEILGALISGLIAGLVHLAYNSFHIENKVENICNILNAKDRESCKKVVESAMDATEDNMDNYTVQLK